MLRKPHLWEWLVCIGIVALLAGVFIPIGACACGGPNTACLSQVKRQGLGVLQYASDWDERLPHRDGWMDVIEPYITDKQIFHDPMIKSEAEYGYSFNSRLSGGNQYEFTKPGEQTMIFDSINLGRNASDPFVSIPHPGRHKGRNNLSYLDGHVKSIPSQKKN